MLKRIVVALALSLLVLGFPAHAAQKIGPEFVISTDQAGSASVAALRNGGFVVTWVNRSGQQGSFGRIYTANANAIGDFSITSEQTLPSVAALRGGGFVVIWASSEGVVRGQRYAANGVPVGANFRANAPTSYAPLWPSVAGLEDGGFVVVWQERKAGALEDVYGQRYDAAGVRAGSQFRINIYHPGIRETQPLVAGVRNGGFVVAWNSRARAPAEPDAYARRFNANGASQGSEFKLPSPGAASIPYAITGLNTGGFVILVRRGEQNLAKTGFEIHTFKADGTPNPRVFHRAFASPDGVAPLTGGGFVAVWLEIPLSGPFRYDIFGQRYTDDGQRTDLRFAVSTTAGDLFSSVAFPEVAGLGGGNFVVIWNKNQQQVLGQRFQP